MLITGPVMKARQQYARELQQKKYGRIILVPASSKIINSDGRTVTFNKAMRHDKGRSASDKTRDIQHFCKYMEDTHRELILGKRMMLALGLHSVIIVSSPYHMRRIRLIASRVFDSRTFRLNFTATPYGPRPSMMWWADRDQRWWVFNEWIKLAWFIIYAPFCNT